MGWLVTFWRSSVGGKVTMALTGLALYAFVVAHLLGNLLLLAGPGAINDYAQFLAERGALLWLARGGLLAVFVLHVVTGIRLARANAAARPVAYAVKNPVAASWASRSMLLTGLTTFAFVVYHLLHFTFGVTNPDHYARKAAGHGGHDVHSMVTASFAEPGIAIAYVAFQVLLFFHLSHGFQSFAQTLGIHHGRWTPLIRGTSVVLALLVTGGNVFLALSVLLGVVEAA